MDQSAYLHPELHIDPKRNRICSDGFITATNFLNAEWLKYSYRRGVFPMYLGEGLNLIGWFYPSCRAVFDLSHIICHRSMMKFIRGTLSGYSVWINRNPAGVMRACSLTTDSRSSTWITEDFISTYPALPNFLSVEVYNSDDQLAGGLYGLCLGKLFAGESMFSFETNTSKLAFYFLAYHCCRYGIDYIDSQILNDHTESLGCRVIDNSEYERILHHYSDIAVDPSFFDCRALYPASDADTEGFMDFLLKCRSNHSGT
jgi:leucyl/phenylalanyl-tRNA--protein transferase